MTEPGEGWGFRRALIETLRAEGHVRSARVAAALAAVPREVFLPGLPLEAVYRPSEAIVTKRQDGLTLSSASAPDVVALMLEQLDVRPGDRVLEIGAGTGYNAALLAHLVGESGHVVTLDIDEDLVRGAQEHLSTAGFDRVEVVQADGAIGPRDDRLYDRIILTVSSSDIAPAWRDQLAPDHGRLVLPLGLRGQQRCVAFKSAADHLVSDSVRACCFIPLRGLLASTSSYIHLGPGGARVVAEPDESLGLPEEAMAMLLDAPTRTWPSGVSASLKELRQALHLWLVTHLGGMCSVWGGGHIPDLFGPQAGTDVHGTLCLVDAGRPTLAMLGWADAPTHGGELVIQAPDHADELVERVRAALQQWHAAGRPTDADLQIRAYARGTSAAPERDEVVVERRWSRFILTWNRG
ncbi:MAG: methyltransferase, FxLD system [Chloroflexota bacterium]